MIIQKRIHFCGRLYLYLDPLPLIVLRRQASAFRQPLLLRCGCPFWMPLRYLCFEVYSKKQKQYYLLVNINYQLLGEEEFKLFRNVLSPGRGLEPVSQTYPGPYSSVCVILNRPIQASGTPALVKRCMT